ncbi:MAG: BlaI/MecI/CopY family transcriptional regulator [Eubacteriales bacterium]|nr:BlaI/MecI/CopY family transcriptional regulator [Eubacteriales bacterium]
MKKKIKKLTDSEKQVLNLLWDSEEPLTSTEIVNLCTNRTWKPSYIHIMINSLLSKEMIQIDGFKKTTKNYARTFKASMSRDEWNLLQVKQEQKSNSKTLSNLFATLVEEETNPELLDKLSEILDHRKKELCEQGHWSEFSPHENDQNNE